MGTDPGRTVGVRGSTVSGFGSRVSGSTQDSPQQRSELWLILNMSRARSVKRSLWPARNFFVCRKPTVIVLTAAMNFRSALLPPRTTKQPINTPVEQRHDLARQSRNATWGNRHDLRGPEYALGHSRMFLAGIRRDRKWTPIKTFGGDN